MTIGSVAELWRYPVKSLNVDRRITAAVACAADRCPGVYCWTETGGGVRVEDDVALREARAPRRMVTGTARRAEGAALGVTMAAVDRLSR